MGIVKVPCRGMHQYVVHVADNILQAFKNLWHRPLEDLRGGTNAKG